MDFAKTNMQVKNLYQYITIPEALNHHHYLPNCFPSKEGSVMRYESKLQILYRKIEYIYGCCRLDVKLVHLNGAQVLP